MLMHRCLIDPELSTAGAIILSIAYGYDASESENEPDPLVKLAELGNAQFSEASTPGAFLVDFIPWCEFVLFCLDLLNSHELICWVDDLSLK